MLHSLLFLLVSFVIGCSPSPDAGDTGVRPDSTTPEDGSSGDMARPSLMDNELWTAVSAADDPFDDRPAEVDCERGVGWDTEPLEPEPSTVGIDTSDCNYFAVEQPTRRAIESGGSLAVQLWHFQLIGAGPAHVAVALDGVVVWEQFIELPRESELIIEEFEVSDGAPEGAQLVFHLHNHGLNSYNLIAIREPAE